MDTFKLSGPIEGRDVKADFEEIIQSGSDQRSKDWHQIRAGRFTASEIHKLFTSAKDKKEAENNLGFGATAVTYIKEKAMETYLGQSLDSGAKSYDMRFGEAMEEPAKNFYELKTGDIPMPATFIPYGKAAGGSPDFISEKYGIGEIKVPAPATHATYLFEISSMDDLRRVKKEYWYQIMTNAVISGLDHGVFISFDPRQIPQAWMEIDFESFSGYAAYEMATEKQRRTAMLIVDGPVSADFKNELDEIIDRATRLRDTFVQQIQNRLGK